MVKKLSDKISLNKISSKARFSGALGGNQLDSILLAAPHQAKLQALVGKRLKKETSSFSGLVIEILEIGTGTGLTSAEILKADSRIKLRTVDNEPKMIKAAKKNLSKFIKCGRLKIIQVDALEFIKKISNKSYDAVATSLTLHNFERNYREKILLEIFRILKTGGIFINADKYASSDVAKFRREYAWQIRQFRKIPDETTRMAWIRHYETDNNPEIIMREKEEIDLMEKIGFQNTRVSARLHLEALLVAHK